MGGGGGGGGGGGRGGRLWVWSMTPPSRVGGPVTADETHAWWYSSSVSDKQTLLRILLYTIAYDHYVTCSLAPRLSILVPRSYSRPQAGYPFPTRTCYVRLAACTACSPSPCPIRSQDEVKEQQLESGLMVTMGRKDQERRKLKRAAVSLSQDLDQENEEGR